MFQTVLVQPIYNAFIYLVDLMPHGDVGLAIIFLTILIRAVFYPAFSASIRTQMGMQLIQGEMDDIQEKYKDNPEERTKRTMELLKKNNIKPFSSFLSLLIQLPVFFALYYAFFREGLPKIATDLLYPFVGVPAAVNMQFLGLINLAAAHNIILAILVGTLQFGVMWLSISRVKKTGKSTPEKEMAQKTQQQLMLYFFPVLMTVLAYSFPAAVGLYFATTNVISLGQEWLIRRELQKKRSSLA